MSRKFTGDNSYNNSSFIEGNYQSGSIDPNKEVRDRQQDLLDSLKSINDTQLSHVSYRRIVPAVNSDTKLAYKKLVASSRVAINNIKNCFTFHNTDCSLSSYGLTTGSIDENSFHKVYFGETDRLYERRDVVARKKWLVTILIDQSGSMNHHTGKNTTRMTQARELSILFAEALKSLKDTDFSIYGFSTYGETISTFCYHDKQTKKLEALIEAGDHNGTGIGFHVAHVGDKMISQYPDHDNKILFVITDGEPNATASSTMDGYQHTNYCCNLLRSRGINVFGIGIDKAFGNSSGERLFGQNNFVVIDNVANTLNILTNSLRNFFKRTKK